MRGGRMGRTGIDTKPCPICGAPARKTAYLYPGKDVLVTPHNSALYWNPTCECRDVQADIPWPYAGPVMIWKLVKDRYMVIS